VLLVRRVVRLTVNGPPGDAVNRWSSCDGSPERQSAGIRSVEPASGERLRPGYGPVSAPTGGSH
jgi:hypothetical protein